MSFDAAELELTKLLDGQFVIGNSGHTSLSFIPTASISQARQLTGMLENQKWLTDTKVVLRDFFLAFLP